MADGRDTCAAVNDVIGWRRRHCCERFVSVNSPDTPTHPHTHTHTRAAGGHIVLPCIQEVRRLHRGEHDQHDRPSPSATLSWARLWVSPQHPGCSKGKPHHRHSSEEGAQRQSPQPSALGRGGDSRSRLVSSPYSVLGSREG